MKPFAFGSILIVVLIAVGLTGCHLLLPAQERELRRIADQIEETDERTVSGCRYLGTVDAQVDPRTIPERHAIKTGRKIARRHAAEIGATHIVWLYSHQTAASAKAYDCRAADQ